MPEQSLILIIEDNADAAESLAILLEMVGYKPMVAGDGLEGLQAARAHRPAAILCDIGLPGLSGYEIATCLRQEEGFRSLPMLAISGYAQRADRQRALEAGFDDHMAKPVNLDRVIRFLAGARPGAAPGAPA